MGKCGENLDLDFETMAKQDTEFSHGISRVRWGMVAKIASDEKKPDGQTRIQPSREVARRASCLREA